MLNNINHPLIVNHSYHKQCMHRYYTRAMEKFNLFIERYIQQITVGLHFLISVFKPFLQRLPNHSYRLKENIFDETELSTGVDSI